MKAAIDLEKLRVALRRMSRGNLLMVAERAIEIVPRTKLRALVGDMVRLENLPEGKHGAVTLLAQVRKFHDASLGGEYYESFDVNSKNFMDGAGAIVTTCHNCVARFVSRARSRCPLLGLCSEMQPRRAAEYGVRTGWTRLATLRDDRLDRWIAMVSPQHAD